MFCKRGRNMKTIDALNIYYRELNNLIDNTIETEKTISLKNVFGQRYIGRGLPEKVKLKIYGVPGNDMAAYMDGAELEIFGNAQDAVGNTMNNGRIIVHGNCGDTLGYAMRGGEIYVEGNVGYRVGIHMKEYKEMKPVIVAGGKAGEFLGEYMAGGAIILLGLSFSKNGSIVGRFCGTGMHGGAIYLNGNANECMFGKEAVKVAITDTDIAFLKKHIDFYSETFKKDLKHLKIESFSKYAAVNKNPYSDMYCVY
jgi:glutamate synthase domain-containing protein 3